MYQPTGADIEKLKAFPDCFFFSIDQLIRYVGLSPNSLTAIQELFAILSGSNKKKLSLPYLLRMTPDYNKRGGSAPYIYFLSSDGIKLLRDRGYDPDILALYYKRVRKLVEKGTLPADIDHYLAVTEFIIAARQLPKLDSHLSLHSTIHDWRLRESEYPSIVLEGQSSLPYPFHPDNLTEIHLSLNGEAIPKRIFLEMDMGTHTSRSRFKKKLAAYIDFFSSGTYAKMMGEVETIVILYATPKGEGRRDELRMWTREYFEQQPFRPRKFLRGNELGAEDRSIFRFVSLPEGTLDPRQTMFSPICYPAGLNGEPEPLIRLPEREKNGQV